MPNPSKKYRQLQPEDRVTLATMRQQGLGIRPIARMLGCSLYASSTACVRCQQRHLSARPARKLYPDGVMFGVVCHCLGLRWSPQQLALALAGIYPEGHPYRVSHETIYNCTDTRPVGEFRRELVACLRQTHNKRLPRSKDQDREARSRTCAASTFARPTSRTANAPDIGRAL